MSPSDMPLHDPSMIKDEDDETHNATKETTQNRKVERDVALISKGLTSRGTRDWRRVHLSLFFCISAVMLLSYHGLRLLAFLSTASSFVSSTSQETYFSRAYTATEVLQSKFYNKEAGLWAGYSSACDCTVSYWWNSANCLTTLADLTAVNSSASNITSVIFRNTFVQAQKLNRVEVKLKTVDYSGGLEQLTHSLKPQTTTAAHFVNNFYDDDAWWGLAWIGVYDLTHEKIYLDAAVDIFYEMAFTGYNATCGAMYWNKAHQQQNAITNELFLSLAAHLANRVENSQYYVDWALRQWTWFESSGLIQPSGLIVDGLNTSTCIANAHDPSFSYNQGVILGGLVELNKVHPNQSYIDMANKIATAAIGRLTDSNGVLAEYGFASNPNMGTDLPTFKGVFIRNLRVLQKATGNSDYADYILHNADSIWNNDRSPVNGTLGNLWYKYTRQILPQGHCAALDGLVAAASLGT
jgi:predicted alpha-1,6-mannanase (GH76 family)